MKEIESYKCFDGKVSVWEHESVSLKCSMRFATFLPPKAEKEPVPFVTFLSGLTCSHENFMNKAGAFESASQEGLAIIIPDTSPRGEGVSDNESYDLGQGAGFYINATQEPWSKNFQMETYIVSELNALILKKLPLIKYAQGIFGHSMGGHGALMLALKYPDIYKSVSAFSPIVAPSQVPWGRKAFKVYLGENEEEWRKYDACFLMSEVKSREDQFEVLIDQGLADQFLTEQLKPHVFEEACKRAHQNLHLRQHEGYDHSYYFIQSFIKDHIFHHKKILSSFISANS